MSSASPDHIYLDLALINNDNQGNSPKSSLTFNDVRTNPILTNPSNYFMTIARFAVDTPAISLPMFIPLLNMDGTNSISTGGYNQTAYTITIAQVVAAGGGGTQMTNLKTVNVLWAPQDATAYPPKNPLIDNANPNSPFVTQDITTGYYNCYSVEWWLNCVNNALATVWTTATGDSANIPFMTVQPLTNLITLYTSADPNYNLSVLSTFANGLNNTPPTPIWGGSGTFPSIKYAIFFNEPLFNLFSSLNSVYYGGSIGANAATIFTDAPSIATATSRPYLFNYYIQPVVYPTTVAVPATSLVGASTFYPMVTGYSPVPMWNPVQSIVFTSVLLPIVPSLTTQPIPYGNPTSNSNISSGNNAGVTNIMNDIQVDLVSGNEYKPKVLYLPQAEYRLVDLNDCNTINEASFSVFWKTKYSQLMPFFLGAQCSANIKILFRRKRFNLGNLAPYNIN